MPRNTHSGAACYAPARAGLEEEGEEEDEHDTWVGGYAHVEGTPPPQKKKNKSSTHRRKSASRIIHTWMRTVAAVTVSRSEQGRPREGLVPVSRGHLQVVDGGVRPLERVRLGQDPGGEEPEGRDGVEQAHRSPGQFR